MKTTSLLSLILCFSISLNAQLFKLTGKVLSEDSNEPLEEVMILVEALQKVSYTNADGTFEVTLPKGIHTLAVSTLGMQPDSISIHIKKDTVINLLLEQQSVDLESVEITARKQTNGITRLNAIDGFGIYEAKPSMALSLVIPLV